MLHYQRKVGMFQNLSLDNNSMVLNHILKRNIFVWCISIDLYYKNISDITSHPYDTAMANNNAKHPGTDV